MNLLSFAFHTVCDLVARLWRDARDVIGTRRRFFEELRTITRYLVFADWGALIRSMITGDPTAKIICVSYSDDLAVHFSRYRRTALESRFIRLLFPKLRISKKKNTEKEIVTTRGGGIYTTSVGGTMTGRGADYIIIDDPIKPGEAMSEAERNKVNDWYRNTAFSRLNNKNTGRIIIVSQRVHHDDLIGHLLETEGEDWAVLVIPAIATEDEKFPIGNGEHYFRKEGEPIQPERENHETLDKIKRIAGSYVYASQYQQNPMLPDGVIIHLEWFRHYRERPGSFDLTVDSWDTASGIGSDSAYSACTTWGILNGELYLLDCKRYRLEFPGLLRQIVHSARTHRVDAVLVEHASSGIQIVQSLKGASFNVIPIQPKGDKESRAIQVSPIIESGRVHIPVDAPWLGEFLNEVARFPHSKFKDQVDSMTQFLLWAQNKSREQLGCRITIYPGGGKKEVYRDKYFERMGRGVFDDLL